MLGRLSEHHSGLSEADMLDVPVSPMKQAKASAARGSGNDVEINAFTRRCWSEMALQPSDDNPWRSREFPVSQTVVDAALPPYYS